MDNYNFKMKIGEVGKELVFYVKDADGAFVDLTGKAVKFTMVKGSTKPVDLGTCEVDADQTANRGKAVYTFGSEANDLTETTYRGEFCVVDGGNPIFYPDDNSALKDFISIKVTRPLAIPV